MRKIKKATAILLTGIILSGTGVNTYAVTPQYRPPKTDFTIEGIVDAVKNYLKENPIEIGKLNDTKITQAVYYHKKLYFNRARLQVRWDEVGKAKYYEVKVTKKNGESKIYNTSDTSLFVYEKSDNFVTGCVRSGKVKVRAISADGKCSDWSSEKTISCISLHR